MKIKGPNNTEKEVKKINKNILQRDGGRFALAGNGPESKEKNEKNKKHIQHCIADVDIHDC